MNVQLNATIILDIVIYCIFAAIVVMFLIQLVMFNPKERKQEKKER